MAYNDFTLTSLRQQFGLQIRIGPFVSARTMYSGDIAFSAAWF